MNLATSRLPILIVPLLGAILLGWLLLDFGGSRHGLEYFSTTSVEYIRDRGGKLTLAQIREKPPEAWQTWSGRYIEGPRRGAVWARVTIGAPEGRTLHGILENDDFFADRVDAWVPGPSGELHMVSGEAVPNKRKEITGREVVFPVTTSGPLKVLMRFQDFAGPYLRPVWWPRADDFYLARARGNLAEGVYLGCLFALLGYNSLLWARLRQRDIGYYVLYLGSLVVFILLGRAQLPALGIPLGTPWLETVLSATMGICGIFLTQFARVFLELGTRFPRCDRWARVWILLLALMIAGVSLNPWLTWHRWLTAFSIASGITHLALIVMTVAAWRDGLRQAKFFAASFGCLFAGSLPLVLVSIFGTAYRDVGMRGAMIGSALEMLMLSLAVADRFARTQQQLVEETEQRRAIEAAYADELEEEVGERTRELSEANTDKDRMLAVIGHDLRGPLAGLMRAADGAEGGFSRNVERTSRALLLMIEDLVLWARLSAGSSSTATHRAAALAIPAVVMHHSLAEESEVELLVDVPDDLRVETDLVLAQTLVRNLLANALKFARARVMIRGSRVEGGVWMSVINDGPELPPEVAARLAADQDEPITPTGGLGLKLCREICHALDLKLEARTPAQGGAEFGFIIKEAPPETLHP